MQEALDDEHRKNPDFSGVVWAVIEVPVERYSGPAEKMNITVPAPTLKRIDEHAALRGESLCWRCVRDWVGNCGAGAAPLSSAVSYDRMYAVASITPDHDGLRGPPDHQGAYQCNREVAQKPSDTDRDGECPMGGMAQILEQCHVQ